jgi:hypothetical protein
MVVLPAAAGKTVVAAAETPAVNVATESAMIDQIFAIVIRCNEFLERFINRISRLL